MQKLIVLKILQNCRSHPKYPFALLLFLLFFGLKRFLQYAFRFRNRRKWNHLPRTPISSKRDDQDPVSTDFSPFPSARLDVSDIQALLPPASKYEDFLVRFEPFADYRNQLAEELKRRPAKNGRLTRSALILINNMTMTRLVPKFQELTWKSRKERRELLGVKGGLDFYEKRCLAVIYEFEEHMNQEISKIISEFLISYEFYQQSLIFYMENDEEFQKTVLMAFEKVKVANKKKAVDLSEEQVTKILQRQIKIFESNPRKGDSALDEETRAPVRQMLATDMIFWEFGVEEEDILLNIIENNWETHKQIGQLLEYWKNII